jgi:hypothetical protein
MAVPVFRAGFRYIGCAAAAQIHFDVARTGGGVVARFLLLSRQAKSWRRSVPIWHGDKAY